MMMIDDDDDDDDDDAEVQRGRKMKCVQLELKNVLVDLVLKTTEDLVFVL